MGNEFKQRKPIDIDEDVFVAYNGATIPTQSAEEIVAKKDLTIRNKNLSIECLKNIIKKKERMISVRNRELEQLYIKITKLESRPFWRFWE